MTDDWATYYGGIVIHLSFQNLIDSPFPTLNKRLAFKSFWEFHMLPSPCIQLLQPIFASGDSIFPSKF
jgi:hypothetical protein